MRRTLAFLACLSLLLSAVFADGQLVRVGWYPIEKLEEYDTQGNPSGYGKDCLSELARYTNFSYEYVAGSFEECLSWLESGDVDLMLFMKYTPARGELVDYADYPLFKVSSVITCLKENADGYKDISSIDGKIVALEAKAIQTTELDSFIQEKGIRYTPLYCADSAEAKAAVDNGIADYVLLPSVVPLSERQTAVESFDTRFSTITVSKTRPDILEKVNMGITTLLDNDPSFFQNSYQAYFGTATNERLFLTEEEKAALKRLGTMRVNLSENNGYLSRYVDGSFTGIKVDMVKLIAKKLGLGYEFVRLTPSEEAIPWQQNDKFDFVCGIYFDYDLAKRNGYQISLPYLTYKYYCMKNKTFTGTQDEATVAVLPPGNYFTDRFIVPMFRKSQLIQQGTTIDCLNAVNKGKADMTYMSSYVAEYYLNGYEYTNVTASITDFSSLVCLATREGTDPAIISAINKAIGSITAPEIQAIILQNTLPNESNTTVKGLFNKNPVFFSILFCAIVVIIIVAILLVVFYRKLSVKNRQLEKANKAKSEFLSRMSHDMRTPLNAVLGFASLAEEESDLPAKTKDYLGKIMTAGNFLLSLINDVLDMSKIENGKFVLNEESVYSPTFLSSIAEVFVADAKDNGITLVPDFTQAETKWIIMDPVRTRQIYSNLLSNAIKFSKSGTLIRWTVKDVATGEGTIRRESSITDHGSGMSAEFMKRMFKPFEQGDAEKSTTGTGLGLSIVKNLITMMGGTVTAHSELGQGTTFTISIDRKLGKEVVPKEKETIVPPSMKGKRILLCEDNKVNTMVAVRFLEKTGCDVDCATDGEQGVKLFAASAPGHYTLIIMDIRMPHMDGLQATMAIRKMARGDAKTIPIIAMSANAFEEDIRKSIDSGIDAHLSKPIDPKSFYQVLGRYQGGSNCEST